MKTLNFWRTLFCSVLAVAAFAACSDDDDKGFSGEPTITVNGTSTTTVATDLDGGDTEAVEVVSSGRWTLTFQTSGADAWCTPSAMSGDGGTTMLKFNLAKSTVEREATVLLTTWGKIAGYEIKQEATIVVKQNEGGSTEVETNVKATRAALTFGAQSSGAIGDAAGNQITESKVITGIVISDYVGNNINNHQVMLTDNTTEPGAGLMIRFKGYVGSKTGDHNLTCGSIISFDLKGGYAKIFKQAYVVTFVDADPEITIQNTEDNTPAPIEITDPTKLMDYQSQYVKIYSQPDPAYFGKMYYTNTSSDSSKPSYYYEPIYNTKDGQTFKLSVSSYSTWATTIAIPENSGDMKGCVSVYDAVNVSPRNAQDVAGMTQPLFSVTPKSTTIAEITTAGAYELKNVIVTAASSLAYTIADNTGAMLVYHKDNTRKVGDKIDIAGNVTIYNATSTPQFNEDATVTLVSSGNAWTYNPTVYTASQVEAYKDNIKVVDIEITGKLIKDNNFYNLIIDGTDMQGSINYYTPDADLLDRTVIIKGYAMGTSTSAGVLRIKIFPYSIEADANTPYINADDAASFQAAGETKEIAYTAGNLGANNVYAKITGTNAAQFEITNGPADGKVNVKALENTSSNSMSATLTIFVAASESAAAIVSADVVLSQAPAGVSSYVPVLTAPADWSGEYVVGYPDGASCNILNEKYSGAAAEKSTFTYETLTAPAFDGTNIVYNPSYKTVTIAKIPETNYYSIKYGDMYVGWTTSTGNSCQFTKDVPSAATPDYQWTITIEDKLIHLTCSTKGEKDKAARTFQFNANSNQERFAIYASTQKFVMLYKLQ